MNLNYEKRKQGEGYGFVIGCDEVGRGCLAGPVVAAAVALPDLRSKIKGLGDIRDSKLLTPKKREELSEIIRANFLWSIAEVSSEVVDKINIHNASLLAMRRAVESLAANSEKITDDGSGNEKFFLTLDGKFCIPKFNMKQEAVVGGDNKIISVAAASIVAKVHRDELMRKYHLKYPEYDFFQHKGYATLHHREMVKKHGLSKIHRVSFCANLI